MWLEFPTHIALAVMRLQTTRAMLRAKGNSIEGGTSEVQLNIISKRVLEMPDHKPQSAGK